MGMPESVPICLTMSHLISNHHYNLISEYSELYLKNKPPDCCLYSEDGHGFKMHKESLGQTKFMRELMKSANCCGILEIICPCSKEELEQLISLLVYGKIQCVNEKYLSNIFKNLIKIFGFPVDLDIPGKFTLEDRIENSAIQKDPGSDNKAESLEIISDDSIFTISPTDIKSEKAEEELQAGIIHIKKMDESFFNKGHKIETSDIEPKIESKKELDNSSGNEENISNNGFSNAKFETEVNTSHTTSHPSFKGVVPVSESNPKRDSNVSKTRLKITSKNDIETILPTRIKSNVKKQKKKQVFICEHCSKNFVNKWNLDNHIKRIHLKTLKSICPICNQSFGNKNSLKNHHNVKHAQNPIIYKCKFCDKALKHPSMLNKHQKLYCHLNPNHKKFAHFKRLVNHSPQD